MKYKVLKPLFLLEKQTIFQVGDIFESDNDYSAACEEGRLEKVKAKRKTKVNKVVSKGVQKK